MTKDSKNNLVYRSDRIIAFIDVEDEIKNMYEYYKEFYE